VIGGGSTSGSIPPVPTGRRSRLLPAPEDRRGLLIALASTIVVFTVLGYVVLSSPGWPRFQQSFLNPEVFAESWPRILRAFGVNVQLFLMAEVLVLALGLLVAVLRSLPGANGKIGAVGFCWGGAMVNRIAAAAGDTLDAGVPFYGSGLDPALAPRVEAAMLLHYAGLDERVNGTGLPWAQALKAAGKDVEWHVYDGVNHAFHNDTSAERYNAAAAKLAWERTLAFFGRELGS